MDSEKYMKLNHDYGFDEIEREKVRNYGGDAHFKQNFRWIEFLLSCSYYVAYVARG